MRDLHVVVVHHDGQVVSRETIGLEEHLVVHALIVEGHVAMDQVVVRGGAGQRHGQPDDGHDAGGFLCAPFGVGHEAALTVVAKRLLARFLLPAHLLESFGCAVALVGVPMCD